MNYLPEYFCGDKFNPACESCKANDSSWDPDDPFSAFPSPSQPTSLVSHWLLTPRQQPPQNPSSIMSLVTHCIYNDDSDKDKETKKEGLMSKEDIAELMAELRAQLKADRDKILAEVNKDFTWFKDS